jgi:diguanylate cyclase (GGDEF)-like protein/PAS domain S-box-containing protein
MISLRYRRVAWLIALFALLCAGLTAHLSRKRVFAMAEEVSHTIAVREAITTAVTLLSDAETGQRGYLLTGDVAFLEPHYRASAKFGGAMATLRDLTRDDARQQEDVRRIEQLAGQKLAELAETIELRRGGQQDAALAIVRDGRGKRVMDTLRSDASLMLDREQARLADRRRASSRAQTQTSIVLLAGLALAVAMVLGGLAMVRRDVEDARLAGMKTSESERTFRMLADNAGDLIRILGDDGAHLYVSPSSKHLLGYRAEELRAMTPESLLPEADRIFFLPGRGDYTSRGTQSILHRMKAKNGEVRWFETRITTAIYETDGKPRVYLASRDITERKEIEDELRSQTTMLQSIVANMGDGLVVVNARREFVIINPAIEPYLDQRVGDTSGEPGSGEPGSSEANRAFLPDGKTPFPPDDGPLSRALNGESSHGVEMVMLHEAGFPRTFSVTARPLRDADRITGAVAVFHDITAQRLAERDLLESEQRWRVLSESSFEGMAVTRGGQILDTNATFASWLGRDPSDLVGIEGISVFAPEDRARVSAMSRNGATGAYEAHMVRHDGTKFPVEVRVRAVVFRGQPVRISVVRDITERKAHEAELAQRAERLRELSLRDELTKLYNRRGFLELARQQLRLAARARRYLTVFYADLNGMKAINDVLGHEMGDRALVVMASILTNVFRTSDIVARLGGDEFAVLATECDAQGVEAASVRVRALVEQHNHMPDAPFQLSVSIGAAVYDPAAPSDLEALMKRADEQMYELKRARADAAAARRPLDPTARRM